MLTATKTTLRVATPDSFVPDITLVDNLPAFQVLEDRTNVRVEWEVVYPEYDTVMMTRLAAAADLPDIGRRFESCRGSLIPFVVINYSPHRFTRGFLCKIP